ncbi:MAG: NAD(P)-dependent oxidoreductase [Betaproteobacteria bacterium]|nr:MAG: NAD(P)-dependent oxidoreductase [Betaproteobacteria bacterium]
MKIERIGFMTPGDMGQAVAMQLKQKGFTVCTALGKRSERSRNMAAEIGLTDLGSIARLTAESDLVMSVMNPGAALEFAREAAAAIRTQTHKPVFIDCNAVAPDTMREIDAALQAAGSRCLDGGIIGPPPRGTAKVNLYVSGPGSADLEQLGNEQLRVHILSERMCDASAVKMCYSAFNKGTQGLLLETLMASHRLGVADIVEKQLLSSKADMYEWLLGALPTLPPKAYRWVPEMHEIARTFEGVGMTPRIFQGEADMFEMVAATALGKETPENRDRNRTGKDVIKQLAADRK